MTREGAQKHEDIIKAFTSGKDVEYFDVNADKWIDALTPIFEVKTEYRIKSEEPELTPLDFSDAERLIGKSIKSNVIRFICLITAVDSEGVWANSVHTSYNRLLKYYKFLDGSPIGKLQK